MKYGILFTATLTLCFSSAQAGIAKSKHDNTRASQFEKKKVVAGKGIQRDQAIEHGESHFERSTVSRWSDAKRARIAKARAAKAKASKGKKRCSGGG